MFNNSRERNPTSAIQHRGWGDEVLHPISIPDFEGIDAPGHEWLICKIIQSIAKLQPRGSLNPNPHSNYNNPRLSNYLIRLFTLTLMIASQSLKNKHYHNHDSTSKFPEVTVFKNTNYHEA